MTALLYGESRRRTHTRFPSFRNTLPKSLLKHLVSLRVTLSTAKLSWIRQFVENGRGISAIGGALDRVLARKRGAMSSGGQYAPARGSMSPQPASSPSSASSAVSPSSLIGAAPTQTSSTFSDVDEDIQSECVKCLRSLLNTEPGFVQVLTAQPVVSRIAFTLFTPNDKLKSMAGEVLAALTLLGGDMGHKLVVTAMSDFRGFYNERYRFEYLVESVIGSDPLSMSSVSFCFDT
jgi:diaphanous 1